MLQEDQEAHESVTVKERILTLGLLYWICCGHLDTGSLSTGRCFYSQYPVFKSFSLLLGKSFSSRWRITAMEKPDSVQVWSLIPLGLFGMLIADAQSSSSGEQNGREDHTLSSSLDVKEREGYWSRLKWPRTRTWKWRKLGTGPNPSSHVAKDGTNILVGMIGI